MNERNRRNEGESPVAGGPGAGGPGDGRLQEMRSQADRLLATGDRAIHRALSRDSERFLNTSRQQGGQ